MIRNIVTTKQPSLRKPSKPVGKFDKKIASLIADLKETLVAQTNPEGVGLAAPQIGKNLQVFVMDTGKEIKAVINPQIVSVAKEKKGDKKKKPKIMEGCLSLPDYYGPLKRSTQITIRFMDESGNYRTETFEGLPAQIVQHEIDHLNGVLFVDRILQQKQSLYKLKGDEWQEVEL